MTYDKSKITTRAGWKNLCKTLPPRALVICH
jgi:hypothetical protein